MTIRGAIFDMDGTVLDSMAAWETLGMRYVLSKGLSPEPNLNDIIKNMSMDQSIAYLKKTYGITDDDNKVKAGVYKLIEDMYFKELTLKPYVKDFLEKLKNQDVLMCVATATDRFLIEPCLKRLGILDYFSEIFTCDEVKAGKDTPVIYQKALEHLGTSKDETVVFEDVLHAVETLKKSDFLCACVYDESSKNDWETIKNLSDFVITSFEDAKL